MAVHTWASRIWSLFISIRCDYFDVVICGEGEGWWSVSMDRVRSIASGRIHHHQGYVEKPCMHCSIIDTKYHEPKNLVSALVVGILWGVVLHI